MKPRQDGMQTSDSRATDFAVGDVSCQSCGYCLKGLSTSGRCPECGELIGPSLEPGRRDGVPLTTFGRVLAYVVFIQSLMGLIVLGAFHLRLAQSGLTMHDLWLNAKLASNPVAAAPLVSIGTIIAGVLMKVGAFALLGCLYVAGSSIWRRNFGYAACSGFALLATALYTYKAVELGFMIAGV